MKTIPLTNSPLLILVDDEDWLELSLLSFWYVTDNGYPQSTTRPKIHLNDFFKKKLGFKDEIDHEDRNKLNYQKYNLRNATRQQNSRNLVFQNRRHSSKYKGVRYKEKAIHRPFEVQITINGRKIYIGSFELEIDAAIAYNKAALQYFGEFAVLNEV